jgi:site-specific recombinase XerD
MMRPDLRLIAGTGLSAMPLAGGIDRYLDRLSRRGARPNTLAAYGSDLRQFAAFAARLQAAEPLTATVSSRDVSRWLDDLSERGISPRSQARKLSVLRAFARFARSEGWTSIDPTADERVRFRARRVIAPELDALYGLVESITGRGRLDIRDRAILRLALDCGLRIGETAEIHIPGAGQQSEIDPARQLLHVVGKGGDTETVTFNARTRAILDDWLRVRGWMAEPSCSALFVSQRGGRLSRQGLHEIIKRRAAAVGLERLHWHLLRHRRVRGIVEACGTKVGQAFARHASEATTAHYGTHADSVVQQLVRERADLDAMAKGRAA